MWRPAWLGASAMDWRYLTYLSSGEEGAKEGIHIPYNYIPYSIGSQGAAYSFPLIKHGLLGRYHFTSQFLETIVPWVVYLGAISVPLQSSHVVQLVMFWNGGIQKAVNQSKWQETVGKRSSMVQFPCSPRLFLRENIWWKLFCSRGTITSNRRQNSPAFFFSVSPSEWSRTWSSLAHI